MKAIILAGGRGMRLRPYTRILPKPLLPVDDIPILEILIRQFKHYGIGEFVVTVGHLAGLIRAYFGDGKEWGVNIRYFEEETPLGTLGSLPYIEGLGDNFLVSNGDIMTDLDFRRLMSYHIRKKSVATVSTFRRDHRVDFGVIELGKGKQIVGFKEKPSLQYDVSMGVYVFNRKVLGYFPEEGAFGFDDLMYRLIAEQEKVFSYVYRGYWRDLGRADDYDDAVDDFVNDRTRFLPVPATKESASAGASRDLAVVNG